MKQGKLMNNNFKDMTEEQLLEKKSQLMERLSYSYRINNVSLIESIRNIIDEIDFILEDRKVREELKYYEEQGIKIHSSVDIGEIEDIHTIEEILEKYKDDE